MTTRVRLDGDGPFLLPAVSGYQGLGADQYQTQAQIRLLLGDERLLLIPIEAAAFEALCGAFHELYLSKFGKS
jgi:hypothetical protein